MTKTLYYVHTNGYDFIMTDDGETRRVTDDRYFEQPRNDDGKYIGVDEFLAAVEDDSGWEQYDETVEEMTQGDCKIIAQVERDDL